MVVVGIGTTPPGVPDIAGVAVEVDEPTDEPADIPLVDEFLTRPPAPAPKGDGDEVGAPLGAGATGVADVIGELPPRKFPGGTILGLTLRLPPDIFLLKKFFS